MHPQLAQWLPDNLPYDLCEQFDQIGRLELLKEAITLNQEWLKLWPANHPKRSVVLYNLGWAVYRRFKQLGQHNDLDEAILLHRPALELRPAPHQDRSSSLSSLACALHLQFEQSGQHKDLKREFHCFKKHLNCSLHPIQVDQIP